MMGMRFTCGPAEWKGNLRRNSPLSGPHLIVKRNSGENVSLSQFDIYAARSAELCAAHGNGPNTSDVQGHNESKSGQRVASRCGTRSRLRRESQEAETLCKGRSDRLAGKLRLTPFQPIRPGLHAEPSGYVLRFVWASRRQVSPTAKGIGVYESILSVCGKEP